MAQVKPVLEVEKPYIKRMSTVDRRFNYMQQNGGAETRLTPKQRRRIGKKIRAGRARSFEEARQEA
jgi:hypothetical protein